MQPSPSRAQTPYPRRWGLVRQRLRFLPPPFETSPTAPLGFPALLFLPSRTNRFIGEALTNDAHQGVVSAHVVIDPKGSAVAVAESELSAVTVQVGLVAMLVNALHAALEDAEIAFDGVGVNVTTNVFISGVSSEIMGSEGFGEFLVPLGFVSVDGCLFGNIRLQDRQQGGNPKVFDDNAFGFAGSPVNQSQDFILVSATTGGFGLLELVADESFINFNNATTSAEINGAAVIHCQTNTMRHEPSGLEGDAKGAVKLVAGNALLAGAHQVDSLQPEVHGDVASLKDGADLDGEGLAARIALIGADTGRSAVHFAGPFTFATMRADPAIRPNPRLNIGVSGGFIVELRTGKNGHDRPPWLQVQTT